jgi:hypothetical protein
MDFSSITAEGPGRHRSDVLGANPLQVWPKLCRVVLAEMPEQHDAIRLLEHWQPRGQRHAADAAAVVPMCLRRCHRAFRRHESTIPSLPVWLIRVQSQDQLEVGRMIELSGHR